MALKTETLKRLNMRMCYNNPRYQSNYFYLFLALFYAPSCLQDEDSNSMMNPSKEEGDDMISKSSKSMSEEKSKIEWEIREK